MSSELESLSGTPRTRDQLLGLISRIDARILEILSDESPDAGATFRVGDREVQRTEYLRWLHETRQMYLRELASPPAWEATTLLPQ